MSDYLILGVLGFLAGVCWLLNDKVDELRKEMGVRHETVFEEFTKQHERIRNLESKDRVLR